MESIPALRPGQILKGPLFNELMRVETVEAIDEGYWAVGLVGTKSSQHREVFLSARELAELTILDFSGQFNGDARLFRLGLQAYALGIAYEFDPLGVTQLAGGHSGDEPSNGGWPPGGLASYQLTPVCNRYT